MEPQAKRNKKTDKEKRNFELTGGLSQKHVRLREALMEQKSAPAKPTNTKPSRR